MGAAEQCVVTVGKGGRPPMKSNPETLDSEIAALAGASRANLTSRWCALYKTEPPRRISRELLKRAIAYRLQELALGGLKPATRRLLARLAADASARRP